MTVWLIVAAAFAALSALLIFGWPLAVYGPRALGEMRRDPQARVLAGIVGSVAIAIIMTPMLSSSLTFSGERALTLAEEFNGLSWGR
ncbi:MAG: hypothetical protein AAFX03_08475 [Pseudomonadota bacterium]